MVRQWEKNRDSIGLVPTMGALHQGHIALAEAARQSCSRVIVTIFVNPKQFNNKQDLLKYPRREQTDIELLSSIPVDAVFIPSVDEIYPPEHTTTIRLGGVALPFEGAMRPGHFDGVATIVTKLFGMSKATHAYFGEKDWQQLQVIRRLVQDLNIPVEIIGCKTHRETDGLAMSSRNLRLSSKARSKAPAIYKLLKETAQKISKAHENGGGVSKSTLHEILQTAQHRFAQEGIDDIEYLALCNDQTLENVHALPAQTPLQGLRLLVAVSLDDVRLIDNITVS